MIFNKNTIKQFKGSRIRLKHESIKYPMNIVGRITCLHEILMTFRLIDGAEIPIMYSKIELIKKVKPFNFYELKAAKLYYKQEYQKAYNVMFELLEYNMFQLPSQLKIINEMIRKAKIKLFMKVREIKGLNEAIQEIELNDKITEVMK